MMVFRRLIAACALPLLLTSCLLQPGKFVSNLTVKADRSFTFAYKGEVIAVDPQESMDTSLSGLSAGSTPPEDESAEDRAARLKSEAEAKAKKAKDAAEREVKRKAAAAALAKEAGYRSIAYLGKGKYQIDYAISGRLDHTFIYPFNTDAEIMLPFIALEVRKDGTVRMLAPAFANSSQKMPGGGDLPMGSGNEALDGQFTLTTDADVVMHNVEEGVADVAGMKQLSWKVTPLTKTPPTAVLRMAR